MDDVLPGLGGPEDRVVLRDWHDYDNYQVVHLNQMDSLVNEGIVIRDALSFRESLGADERPVRVDVRGSVVTANGAVLFVSKWLETRLVNGRTHVRTRYYGYHAMHLATKRSLFRYDNNHGGLETLHCHVYDAEGVEVEECPVQHIYLPTLSNIIRLADSWAAR